MTIASGRIGRSVHFIILLENGPFVVFNKRNERDQQLGRLVSLVREEEKRCCCFKQLTVHQLKERQSRLHPLHLTFLTDLWKVYYRLYRPYHFQRKKLPRRFVLLRRRPCCMYIPASPFTCSMEPFIQSACVYICGVDILLQLTQSV